MIRNEGNEIYLDTDEAMRLLGVSKQTFYANARLHIKPMRFDSKKKPWYRKDDVIALKEGRAIREANIGISGILKDWTTFLRGLGYSATTLVRDMGLCGLPEDAVETFGLPQGEYVRRGRITFANRTPICSWDSYYPVDLVDFSEMKRDLQLDIPKWIAEKHGVKVGRAVDKYIARDATINEQELLQLMTNEPVLILKRASYTRDKSRLVLYSDMVLLGDRKSVV